MFDFSPEGHFHYHSAPQVNENLPVEVVKGTAHGWTKEVVGNVQIKPVKGRTTLSLEGAGAMKIIGSLVIGG